MRQPLSPLALLVAGTLLLGAPAAALADAEIQSSQQAAQTTAQPTTTGPSSSSSTTSVSTSSTATTATPGGEPEMSTTTSTQGTPEGVPVPQVHTQTPQVPSGSSRSGAHAKTPRSSEPGTAKGNGGSAHGGAGGSSTSTHVSALSPSALTPPPPSAVGLAGGGVSNFFIANFSIPPFLLPIYEAAGRDYGIPWQVLAAINEVETDYGRDLSLSSAGAEGWMQFLPSSWAQYGVDASGNGYADPYNPADAIFAAARYLRAAGGARHIDAAIFAYNHSQSYVASVLLRAQLLGATPPELLETLVSLTEARFPVHAAAHFSDGFPMLAAPGSPARTIVGTTIYSQPGAPAIAVQDGTIAAIGSSPTLGRYVKLRDAYGNLYTYAQLGSVATLYPVLKSHSADLLASRLAHAAAVAGVDQAGPEPSGGASPSDAPASAGVQPHSPFSVGAVSSGLALGAAAELETLPTLHSARLPAPRPRPAHRAPATPRVFRAGSEDVFLHPLRVGAHIIAGTVIGHLGAAAPEVTAVLPPPSALATGSASATPAAVTSATDSGEATTAAPPAAGGEAQAHMIFQIRPAGVGAPEIDPKPFLDGWVRLQGSLLFKVTGKHRFPAASPRARAAKAASVFDFTLTPEQWLALVSRLGQIPDPVVSSKPSPAAIPDHSPSAPASPVGEGSGVDN